MAEQKLDVLAFGAHPDDVELGCGGTLIKLQQMGYRVGIIDLTEGEMGTRGSVEERYRESSDAAKIMGISVRENLKIPDGGIEANAANREKVIRVLRRFRPQLVFTHYPADRHPDHVHASRLVEEACFYSGVAKMPPAGSAPHRPRRVIYFFLTYEFSPSFVVDISQQFATKMAAIRAYQSQFYNPDYAAEATFISSSGYLQAIENRAQQTGWKAGVHYAESFFVRELIVVEDLFTALAKNPM